MVTVTGAVTRVFPSVIQALVQNRVVRTDLGLVLPAGDKDGVGDTYVGDAATPLAGSEVRNSDLDSGKRECVRCEDFRGGC